MLKLSSYFWFSWFGLAALSLNSRDVVARDSRYTPVFARMEAEYSAVKGVTNPVDIRRKHSAAVRSFGNFSLDPCTNLVDYSCMGHNNDILDEGLALTSGEYDLEILKYQVKDILLSGQTVCTNEAEQKAKDFFNSCMSYVPSNKDFESVVRKLFTLIDGAAVWSDAFIALHPYGVDFFLHYIFDSALSTHSSPEDILGRSFEDVKDSVRSFLLITNETRRNVNSIAQKVFRFLRSLEQLDPESLLGEPCQIYRLQESYPALNLGQILKATLGYYKSDEKIVVRHKFLQTLNSLLVSTELETIKDVMKVLAYNTLRSTERMLSTSNAIEKCLDITHVFFEPALQSLFIKSKLSEQTLKSASDILRDILEELVKAVRASPDLTKTEKRKAISKVNSKKDLIDRNYMIYDSIYLDSLYEYLDVETKTDFFQLYFDTVFNHNKKMSRCLGLQRSFGRTPEQQHQPDRLKPHLICWGDIPEEFPMTFLNAPYYNAAFPKFWNYGSLSYALLWYSLQMDDSIVPFSRVRFSVWDAFIAVYRKFADGVDELTGYERLGLTATQGFIVAHIQAACNQVDERDMVEYFYLAKEPVVAEVFNCS